jgi:hypothetical protein
MVMVFKEEQFPNADIPILVTDSGIMNDSMAEHPRRKPSGI